MLIIFKVILSYNSDFADTIDCNFCFYSQADLFIQNKFITSGMGMTKKIARKDASQKAYFYLKEHCFTIKVILVIHSLSSFVSCFKTIFIFRRKKMKYVQ